MCEAEFEAGSFHAVGAFYSITHIPPIRQGPLIANIAAWLKPRGVFVASFGPGVAGEWTGEWLGTTMFFGHNGEAETLRCLANSGLKCATPPSKCRTTSKPRLCGLRRSRTASHPTAMSTGTVSDPAIGSGTVPIGARSHFYNSVS